MPTVGVGCLHPMLFCLLRRLHLISDLTGHSNPPEPPRCVPSSSKSALQQIIRFHVLTHETSNMHCFFYCSHMEVKVDRRRATPLVQPSFLHLTCNNKLILQSFISFHTYQLHIINSSIGVITLQ